MTFATDLVLDDADGTDVTYRLRSTTADGSQRIDIATDLRNPALLVIKHTTSGKGIDAVDRHLVQFSRTLTDTNGKPATLTINTTLNVPRNSVITNQIVYDQVANLLDFLSDGALSSGLTDTDAVTALLRGES
jgi:hypothetical protein